MDAAQANVELVKAWLDAHNRGDISALDYMTDDVEIVEMPTGVVWRGRRDMENLAHLAYARKSHKILTHVFATDKEACVEYVTVVPTAGEVSRFEKEWGLHGIDISSAEPTGDLFELAVCFVCEIKDGRIHRAREYWDAASVARQLGIPEQQRESDS
jgi:ketosteroid isomerase-like protein